VEQGQEDKEHTSKQHLADWKKNRRR